MKKKSILSLLIILVMTLVLISGCTKASTPSDEGTKASKETEEVKVIKIGISQIVEHAALDASRNGFIDALKSKGFVEGENLEIDLQIAQGDMSIAQTIAQKFVSDKKDMILAIATPTAQASFNATKDIPILITAVTDPVAAGLVDSLEKPGTNVTGTSDATPIEKQFNLIKELFPDAVNIGMLYNTSEINSEVQVNNAKDISEEFGFNIITSGVTNINEIPQSLDSLLTNIDLLYLPTDNVVASSMPLITSKTLEANIPVIGAERGEVEGGALATEGLDYYNLGFQTGLMAASVINGESPSEMPIGLLEETKLVINNTTAKKLNIEISEKLKERAEIID